MTDDAGGTVSAIPRRPASSGQVRAGVGSVGANMERIAISGADLVRVAKEIAALSEQVTDSGLKANLQAQVFRLLDDVDAISSSVPVIVKALGR